MVHFANPCSFFVQGADKAKRKKLKRSGPARARAAVRILKACVQFGVAWTLEHPKVSRIWTWPPLHRVLMSCVCFVVLIDYCQYGMHYRKPAFLCASRRKFIELGQTCRVTHLHDVSAGSFKMPDGKSCWLMSLACAYPAKLAQVHARIATHLAPISAARRNGDA